MLKKAASIILSLLLLFNTALSAGAQEQDPKLNSRSDFTWGVSMHTPYWGAAYFDTNLEDQVHLAAELGCKLIRIDSHAPFEYLDKFMTLCWGYGIDVMLIVYFPGGETTGDQFSEEAISDYFYTFADRYNGKNGFGMAKYIQIDNELDHTLMMESYPDGNYVSGKDMSQYNQEYIANYARQVQAAIDGIKRADSDVKTIVNFVGDRHGFLDYLYANGIEWDITGIDWYSNIFREGITPFWVGDKIHELYGKPIIVCETNMFGKDEYFDENDPSNWDLLVEAFEDIYSKDYVLGCCIYELSDELITADDGGYDQEGHFGLLFTNEDGTIKEPKPVYYRFKEIFGGEDIEMPEYGEYLNKSGEIDFGDFTVSKAHRIWLTVGITAVVLGVLSLCTALFLIFELRKKRKSHQ